MSILLLVASDCWRFLAGGCLLLLGEISSQDVDGAESVLAMALVAGKLQGPCSGTQ